MVRFGWAVASFSICYRFFGEERGQPFFFCLLKTRVVGKGEASTA